MNFNAELGRAMAKQHCKTCWGRGVVNIQHSNGWPIRNTVLDSNGNVEKQGSVIYEVQDYCVCSRKKIEKLQKGE